MTTKTLYSNRDGSLSVDLRPTGNLLITVTEEFTSVDIYIPADKIKEVVKDLTEIATAPAWTRAKFVRVHPKGYPAYTMMSTGDGEWKSEHHSSHTTESFLRKSGEFNFEVIA